jgi:drug/metabolite transporter (DMT)-like permease
LPCSQIVKCTPYLLLILAGVCWGLGFPLGKLVLRETNAAHLILLRFAVGAVIALPFALRRPEARALFRSPAVLVAGVLYGVAFIVQFEGLARTSVALSALLVGAMPAMIALAAPLTGERVSRISWLGVAAATAGAVLIAGKPEGAGSLLGIALALASLVVSLGWVLILRRAPAGPTPLALPSVLLIVATLAVLPIALVMHGPPKLDLSGVAWTGVIGQGVLSTFVATAAWQLGSARVDSASAGIFINIEPLMGAVLGVSLFGDRMTPALALGGLLIIAGSCTVVLGETTPTPPTPA